MNFLIDRNLESYAIQLLGTLASQGWLELFLIHFGMFHEVELAVNSSDRAGWRFAQENQMILLTANRRMKGIDSLEQTIRQENTVTSLPVLILPQTKLSGSDSSKKRANKIQGQKRSKSDRSLDSQKGPNFRAWASMRSQVAKIQLLVLGTPE